jgi:hypothetical protein
MEELKTQDITDYDLWNGVYLPSVKAGINAAHKQIVEYAKMAGWREAAIAEDDIQFSHPGSWQYFLSQKPEDYDIYLGMVFLGQPDDNGIVSDFTGLTIYIIHQRFYDRFLSMPGDEHIDHLLSKTGGKFIVCRPFIARQYNGWSSNTGKFESYDKLLEYREFYRGG